VLGALFRIGFLAEAVIEAHAKDSRLIRRLAQIEVAGVAVHNRVLVGEVGDIELGGASGPRQGSTQGAGDVGGKSSEELTSDPSGRKSVVYFLKNVASGHWLAAEYWYRIIV